MTSRRESVPFRRVSLSVAFDRAFAAAAAGWAAMLPLASYSASRPAPAPLAYAFAFGVYAVGGVVCHQLPNRSFSLWSAQMPVCARCTGLYAGAALAAVLGRIVRGVLPRADATSVRIVRVLLLVAAAPTVATLVFEWTTGVMPANAIRALAGVPLGAAIAIAITGKQVR